MQQNSDWQMRLTVHGSDKLGRYVESAEAFKKAQTAQSLGPMTMEAWTQRL